MGRDFSPSLVDYAPLIHPHRVLALRRIAIELYGSDKVSMVIWSVVFDSVLEIDRIRRAINHHVGIGYVLGTFCEVESQMIERPSLKWYAMMGSCDPLTATGWVPA